MANERTFYVVRHGATKLNGEDGKSVDKIRGWSDVPLVEKGREEARDAASQLQDKGIKSIHASDLSRAEETSKIIGKALKISPTLSQKLRPWKLGDFTGMPSKEAHPKLAEYAGERPDTPVPGGESFNQFKARAFQGFHEALAAHPDDLAALVTHYRNLQLFTAWDKAGQPPDHSIDIPTFLKKGDDPPGSVHLFKTTLEALKGKNSRRLDEAQAMG